jgi:hypothetical protein
MLSIIILVLVVGLFGLFFIAYKAVKKKLKQIDEVHEIPYSPDNIKDIRFFVTGHYEEIEFTFGDGRVEYLKPADIFLMKRRLDVIEEKMHLQELVDRLPPE